MKGDKAELWVIIISAPTNNKTSTIGASHHAFLSHRNSKTSDTESFFSFNESLIAIQEHFLQKH